MARREHSKDEILFRDMTTAQKISYLKDYWSLPVIIVLVVIIGVFWVIHTARNNVQPVFSVTLVDAPESDKIQKITEEFAKTEGIDFEQISVGNIAIGDASSGGGSYSTQGMALYVRLQAQSEDIVILPRETFYEYAEFGYFVDLAEMVPGEYKEKLIVVDQDPEEAETTGIEKLSCGIATSDIPMLADDEYFGDAVIAISYLPKNIDIAKQFMNYILK